MKNIIFFVSGEGGSLKFLIECIHIFKLNIKIIHVVGDRECKALSFSRNLEIPTSCLNFSTQEGMSNLKILLLESSPELIITNVHKIIPEKLLNLYKNKFLNLHYSLLPSFKGLIGMKTVDEARKIKTKFIGGTAHIIDEKLDEGIIISQAVTIVDWSRSDIEIYNEVFRLSCVAFLNAIFILLNLKNNNLVEVSLNKRVLYNPPLRFELTNLDETFWKKIK